jgi:hypothetical protein
MEDRLSGKPRKSVLDAVRAFQAQHEQNADETKRRYKRLLGYFTEFCAEGSLVYLDQVNVETMDRYALARSKLRPGSRTSSFCGSCSSSAATANGRPRILPGP